MIKLENRGIIEVKGNDAKDFLDNLLTNNASYATQNMAIYAALLSPQGKFLFDCFIVQPNENQFFIDCSRPSEFYNKLKLFKLRSKIELNNLSENLGVFSNETNVFEIGFLDPRDKSMGYRGFSAIDAKCNNNFDIYEAQRISKNIPDPTIDLIIDGDFALEGRLDEMGAIDFKKGCFIGQEMTSRMKRRGTVKQKVIMVEIIGEFPDYNCPINADGLEIGHIRSVVKSHDKIFAMALIRLDRLENALKNNISLLAKNSTISISN